ncbi:MAG: Gldg family protein [bacterium]
MKIRRSPWGSTLFFTACFLGILILFNVLAARHSLRWDLTQDRRYTLSSSTLKILGGLQDPVLVKLYLSRDLPPVVAPLKLQIEDVLREYQANSHGKIRVETIDPARDPEEEKKIIASGVPPLELSVIEKDEKQLKRIFLGMGLFYEDKSEAIPVIGDTKDLEYQITSALLKLTSKELKTVAVLLPDPTRLEKDFGALKQLLEKSYRVLNLDAAKDETLSDKKISTLLVLAPENLSEGLRYEIDQFLMRGGHAVFLVNRAKVTPQLTVTPVSTNVLELLEHYGVKINEDLVADRSNAPATFASGAVQYQMPYPFWVKVTETGMSATDPVTARLNSVVLPWTSSLESTVKEGSKTQVRFLLKSSPSAWVQKPPFLVQPQGGMIANLPESPGTYSLAAWVTGPLKSFYEGKEIPPVKKEGTESQPSAPQNPLTETTATVLLVVGDSRVAEDGFLKQFEDNLVFVMNGVDQMTLGDALLGIRAKVLTDRPLILLSESEKSWIRNVNTFGILVFVWVIGLAYHLHRKRQRKLLAEEYLSH